jgi:hypothetical protein
MGGFHGACYHHQRRPVCLGVDLQGWTYSIAKDILFGLIVYGGVFLVIPLILVKGWQTVRQPGFLLPLLLALIGTSLWSVFRGIATITVLVLAYLHWRFDLSELGFRSKGWRGDLAAIFLYGLLGLLPSLLQLGSLSFAPGSALLRFDRLFANHLSSVEVSSTLAFWQRGCPTNLADC